MRPYFRKVYRSYEEFEREELRSADGLHQSIDDLIDDMFAEELDFEPGGPARRARTGDDEADDAS